MLALSLSSLASVVALAWAAISLAKQLSAARIAAHLNAAKTLVAERDAAATESLYRSEIDRNGKLVNALRSAKRGDYIDPLDYIELLSSRATKAAEATPRAGGELHIPPTRPGTVDASVYGGGGESVSIIGDINRGLQDPNIVRPGLPLEESGEAK